MPFWMPAVQRSVFMPNTAKHNDPLPQGGQTVYNGRSRRPSGATGFRVPNPVLALMFGNQSSPTPDSQMPQKKKTVILGLTSGIACGKTFVKNLFQQKGVPSRDVDAFVDEIWQTDADLKANVRREFGDEVFLPDGSVDRKRLGNIIFSPENQEKKKLLESWIHPKVRERMQAFFAESSQAQEDVVLVEVPLIFESKLEDMFDKVLVIFCTLEQQLRRLMARPLKDGSTLSREEAMDRINSQMPLSDKVARADFVIDNSGTQEETERQVEAFIAALKNGPEPVSPPPEC